jgi:hypothetical protein
MMEFVNPEAVVGLAGLSLILFWLIVGNVRGWYVPGPTHRREMAVVQGQAEQALKDRDKGIQDARADRDKGIQDARDEMTTRMDNFRADWAIRADQSREDHEKQRAALREDHEKQLAALVKVTDGVRADFAVVLAKADRDIDQWRGAWQISDQASREEIAGQLEELVAFARTFARWMTEFQRQTGVPELPRDEANTGGR